MTVDTSKLKTFEDAVKEIENIDWINNLDPAADTHTLAEWIWNNCNQNDIEVVKTVYVYSAENSNLEIITENKLETFDITVCKW